MSLLSPPQLTLDIAPAIQQQAWQQGQAFPRPQNQWTIYLNHLCFQTILSWLQTEPAEPVTPWPSAESLLPIWSVVNGTALTLGSKRLILIPSQTIDLSELCVPQEWVDIPSWAADYYLGVRVDPDELRVQVWGYATHAQIKTQGQYDEGDRTYRLEAEAVIQDISALWVIWQLCPNESTQEAIAPLPAIPQAQTLVPRLANPAMFSPRLELPFATWAAFLEQPTLRQQLYEYRCGAFSMTPAEETSLPVVNLSQWFDNVFESAWQSLETLFAAQPDLAFNFRRYSVSDDLNLQRGQRGIRLPKEFGDEPIALIMSIEREAGDRVKVRSQLYALGASRVLPRGLRLEMVSDTGDLLEYVIARVQDNCIQLPRFKCPPGRLFRLRVALNDAVFSIAFIS